LLALCNVLLYLHRILLPRTTTDPTVKVVQINMHHFDDEDAEQSAMRGCMDKKMSMAIDDNLITIQGQA